MGGISFYIYEYDILLYSRVAWSAFFHSTIRLTQYYYIYITVRA